MFTILVYAAFMCSPDYSTSSVGKSFLRHMGATWTPKKDVFIDKEEQRKQNSDLQHMT